jgi:DNA/RNA-binding domain of Phe-tRNA-synthetase-like protein
MNFTIQKEIKEKFQPCLGIVYATGIDNSKEVPEIGNLLADAAQTLKQKFGAYENPGQHPTIAAWRDTFKKFGTDPKRYRSSVEALARRALKDEPIPRINTLVDLYNYISIKYVFPLGGENTERIRGDLQLAYADGTEEFIVLNGTENDPPEKGEVVYKDDQGVICRMWNWREADRTKLTKETKSAVIVVDAIPPTEKSDVERATRELVGLIEQYCGGNVRFEVLD